MTATTPSTHWNQSEAIALATIVESICVRFHYHVALTGGCLYKPGPLRKDCDLLFYSDEHPEKPKGNREGLLTSLAGAGFKHGKDYGIVVKSKYKGRSVDLMFAVCLEGDY